MDVIIGKFIHQVKTEWKHPYREIVKHFKLVINIAKLKALICKK